MVRTESFRALKFFAAQEGWVSREDALLSIGAQLAPGKAARLADAVRIRNRNDANNRGGLPFLTEEEKEELTTAYSSEERISFGQRDFATERIGSLLKSGYIERDGDKKSYAYRITQKGQELLARKALVVVPSLKPSPDITLVQSPSVSDMVEKLQADFDALKARILDESSEGEAIAKG